MVIILKDSGPYGMHCYNCYHDNALEGYRTLWDIFVTMCLLISIFSSLFTGSFQVPYNYVNCLYRSKVRGHESVSKRF
jgi:hypothetical protein